MGDRSTGEDKHKAQKEDVLRISGISRILAVSLCYLGMVSSPVDLSISNV